MFSTTTKEYAAATKDSAVEDVRDNVARTKREARNSANQAEDSIVGVAENAGRKVRDFIDDTSDKLQDTGDRIKQEVNDNPMQSTLIALGAGFVLGMLFSRR
jgi:ElaB/YqjD/DUF883 family membrane-anchored ribosome-binding protein